MKVRKLSAAALIAVLGVAAMAPTVADATAATHDLTSSGTVKIEAGTLDPDTDPIVDPEKPGESLDPKDPELEKPTVDPGSIGLLQASPLKFGTLNVRNATQTKTAAAYMAGPLNADGTSTITDWTDPAGKVERGNLVVWSDMRGTDDGYSLTAKMTKQFTYYTEGATPGTGTYDPAKVLTGSTITYANPLLATRPDETSGDTTGGLTPVSTFTLGIDGEAAKTVTTIGETATSTIADSQTIVTAPKDSGAGAYTLEFGQSADYLRAQPGADPAAVSTADKSVTLTVPQATSAKMQLGTYRAEITWTLNYTA